MTPQFLFSVNSIKSVVASSVDVADFFVLTDQLTTVNGE